MSSYDKTARWLDLLAYLLQHHFPVTREDIYAHVAGYRADAEAADSEGAREALRRKFERDKDDLRALGIAIETVSVPGAGDEPTTGYRLKPGAFYLPYLELTTAPLADTPYRNVARLPLGPDDVAALDRATMRVARSNVPLLADAAASARRKLEFDLPLPLHTVERVLSRPLDGESERTLAVLQRSLADRTAVRCQYFSIGRDREEERTIEPYGLFFSWGRWYVAALARERGAMRVFRVDRMRAAEALKGPAARFEVPAGFSVRDYVGRAPWELSERAPTTVQVRFGFPDSRWVLARGVGEPVNAVLEDGGALIAFAVRETAPFLRWLLTFGARATIVAPGAMAQELDALRRRVAARYAEVR